MAAAYGTFLPGSVSKEDRMWLNGESDAQMAHVEAIKSAGGVSLDKADGSDTSKDQHWEYDTSSGAIWADQYVLSTTLLWMLPKLILFAVPMLLLNTLPVLIARLYAATLPPGTERVMRSYYFYTIFSIASIVSLPAIPFILGSLILDYAVYYVFSLLYCAFTCRWSDAFASLEKIRPYRNGPSIILHIPDFFIAIVGHTARHGFFETMYMVSAMWLLMPWLKYYICCNPWIYSLSHRLCQQISTSMADCGTADQVAKTSQSIISEAVQWHLKAHNIDSWSFVPHYPFPPPERRWALGLQAGGAGYPGKFTLIVHTTHADSTAGGCTEQFVLSNSCERPIYRVMLWYSNPYHFLTGWVEASISNGMPSQPDKKMGGEHPMWLVTARTPMVSGRDSFTGSGMIDGFFDYWLPVFVHEMRRSSFARRYREAGDPDWMQKSKAYADSKYEEVVSKDGISSPTGLQGMDKYRESTLGVYNEMRDNQEFKQTCRECMQSASQTECGQGIARLQQSGDVCRNQ
eukprot:TRINITY_DN33957_c0_g1_i1.p1 TRINITY_DN33957_c0_g1~~TRINITY_DN33957_c0_g1_i1.p1  ORF type:complete len:517 (+),score=72.43 TRINITY_DN33957_c0_g1_i1:81-1631(+)